MSAESLRSSFTDLGVDVDEDSLQECVRVCSERGLDADTLVEAWVAYSLSALDGARPSVDKIRQLEKKEFGQSAAAAAPQPPGPRVYNVDADNSDDTNVISNYVTSTTPKRIKTEPTRVNTGIAPATLSPTVAQSAKYASRKNAGAVVLSYGSEAVLAGMDKPWDGQIIEVDVTQVPNEDGAVLGGKAMFGFDVLHEMAGVFDNQTRYLSRCIMRAAGLEDAASVRCKSQTEVVAAGRVDCDADARLNAQSVLLHGTWEESLGQSVPLALDQCSQYGLFPGQTVVVRGTNPRGTQFIAQQIYSDAALPVAEVNTTINGTLTMLVTSGPYTPSDSMKYEPLKDFVSYACTHKPHIVLMTGPFLDVDHHMVKTPNLIAETYKSFFEKLLDNISEIAVSSPHTKILIVSSQRDVFHQNIYPAPSYRVRKRHPRVTFLPDPCTLRAGGVCVGVTSTDVLMSLSQEEISHGCTEDKLSRLSRYVIAQQSYSPLWAAGAPCDSALWAAHAHMPATPSLLVLPSNLRYFVKEVNGCVVVNPEHLTKGTGGGTFARVHIQLDESTKTIADRVAVQIIKI